MPVITTHRSFFMALLIYNKKFPRSERGSPNAIKFLRDYAVTLSPYQSVAALMKFADKEELKHEHSNSPNRAG